MSLSGRCDCGKTLTEAERLVGPVIMERERWRESARVSEDEILRLRDQLAGAVDERDRWKALADAALDAVPQDHPDMGVWLVEYADLGGQ